MSRRPRSSRLLSAAAVLAALACLAQPRPAASAPPGGTTTTAVTRVEEDWEVYLSIPRGERGSPQVVLHTAPDPNSRFRCLFLINHVDHPDFAPGGAQLQLWDGNSLAGVFTFGAESLDIPDEKILLTLFMERANGKLRYGLSKVASKSWGTLSPPGFECTASDSTASFPAYSTSVAAENTEILLGSNRVNSLKIVSVRSYAGGKATTGPGVAVYTAPAQ